MPALHLRLLGIATLLLVGALPVLEVVREFRADIPLAEQQRRHGSLSRPGPRGEVLIRGVADGATLLTPRSLGAVFFSYRVWLSTETSPRTQCEGARGAIRVRLADGRSLAIDPSLHSTLEDNGFTFWQEHTVLRPTIPTIPGCPPDGANLWYSEMLVRRGEPLQVWACVTPDQTKLTACHDQLDAVAHGETKHVWPDHRGSALSWLYVSLSWQAVLAFLALRLLRPLAPRTYPWSPQPPEPSPPPDPFDVAKAMFLGVTFMLSACVLPLLFGERALALLALVEGVLVVQGARLLREAARWWRRARLPITQIDSLPGGQVRVQGTIEQVAGDRAILSDSSGQCALELLMLSQVLPPGEPPAPLQQHTRWDVIGQTAGQPRDPDTHDVTYREAAPREATVETSLPSAPERHTLVQLEALYGDSLHISQDRRADASQVRSLVVGVGAVLLALATTTAAGWLTLSRL